MSKTLVAILVALLPMLVRAEVPQEKPVEARETAGLEGEITVKARQLTPKTAEIVVENGVPGVEAITVSVPELDRDLVQVTRESFKPQLEEKGTGSLATLSLDVPALQGTFQNRILYDLGASHVLQLSLLLGDGRTIPVRIHTPRSLAGLEASVAFNKLNGCYTVTMTCSNCSPKTLTKTCCNLPIETCADCPKCSLECYACPPI